MNEVRSAKNIENCLFKKIISEQKNAKIVFFFQNLITFVILIFFFMIVVHSIDNTVQIKNVFGFRVSDHGF